ncbi:dihydropteroate synthase [Adhaeribacter soli]|uniref:dihydropteroate synthase n=1 Tax=Adhaeribacter soli TaxID=2607655 RepID=UPI0029390A14|nr:dihydropteroate synthase [Adhaeribacter soli]
MNPKPDLNPKDTFFSTKSTLNVGGNLLSLADPIAMGILNFTPDSFFAGSRTFSEKTILERTEKLLQEGAAMLDIGGYSSRPGATDIPTEEEKNRIVPAIKSILKAFPDAIISVDTFRASVAEAAIGEGAAIINDISGGSLDGAMFATAAKLQVPYILMHMRGTPQTMNKLTHYENLMPELLAYFAEKVHALKQLGVKDIIIDPGFGFAKTVEQNYEVLNQLESLRILGLPVLAGMSRKSMTYKALGIAPEEALNGTTALNMLALTKGAKILRVHDVKEAVQTIKLFLKTTQRD